THPDAEYFDDNSKIWSVPCDIALPCATQNEIDENSAKNLIQSGVKVVAEGANMPCTSEAIDLFIENKILFGPAQAVNAGGDRKSTRLNSSHVSISYAVFCLKKKRTAQERRMRRRTHNDSPTGDGGWSRQPG